MFTMGIDAGMRYVKLCLLDEGEMIASSSFEMSGNLKDTYRAAWQNTLDAGGLSARKARIHSIVATGYAATLIGNATKQAPASACLAAAARQCDSPVRTVIDAGGFYIRVLAINDGGQSHRELANDKCAAGCGRLLEIAAEALKLPMESLSDLALKSINPFLFTSSCAVFAESEVISQIGCGRPPSDIVSGVIRSLAGKTAQLLDGARVPDPIAITGGLAELPAFVRALESITGRRIGLLPPGPCLASAYGAALLGREPTAAWFSKFTGRFIPERIWT